MASSEQRPHSSAVSAATTPTAAQATPVANPPLHRPSSSVQLQPASSAQQTANSGAQTQGQATGTLAPPAPASTTRQSRPRPVPQATPGGAPATPDGSGSSAASRRESASRKRQPSRHRTANAKQATKSIPRRKSARKSSDGDLRAGTSHCRGGGTHSTSVRRRRRDSDAPSTPSSMVTRSRGSVTRTYQQMEAEAERAIRRASDRRRVRRWEREEEKEERRSGEGGGGKRARVQQVMNPRN